ncbi:MAG: ribosomal protein L11 methyltransferase [Chloroflexi bacterium RBG_13_60_9]|nr:MAG: ribosomal protein L11 methyltransferase [Chloroflexi bacterium RBG_13_60_9]
MKADRIPPAWLEASVRVNEELAESVADVMARFAPNGVMLGYDEIEPDPDGEGSPRGPITVRAYLAWDAQLAAHRAALEEALWHLGRISPIPEPVFREVVETDWSLEWKKHYRPFRIGRRLMIVPSWIEWQAAPGDVTLRLDPGMAFGTGMHPTTRLCLEALEDRIAPGTGMIDLGCGSGILSIAGTLLGAGRVEGWDVDPEAVRIARENAALNGVASRFEARLGTLEDMLKEKRRAPVVAANILAGVLQAMLRASLAETVQPGGCLILSGILAEQSAVVEAAVAESGLHLVEKKTREDWVALIAKKK